MAKIDLTKPLQPQLLDANGPVCLIVTARLKPVGALDRFQPAGFPEVGHVIYDAPRTGKNGGPAKEKVCIVDSPASMANHLEKVCLAGEGTLDLHEDLRGLPHVRCVSDSNPQTKDGQIVLDPNDPKDTDVVSTFTEGHRLASDYFLDATLKGESFRDVLRREFKIIEVKKDKTYFIPPSKWWDIYTTIFKYDPNSLVHGVMFAKEQIKISRLLTAHLEAFGAARVGRSGVKFDRLGKTTSGQPIFSVDEETAEEIRATFVIDLAMLRSYGRNEEAGLNAKQKRLLLDLTLWKISQLLARPFRFRTQCFLGCESVTLTSEAEFPVADSEMAGTASVDKMDMTEEERMKALEHERKLLEGMSASALATINIKQSILDCRIGREPVTAVYYPADKLFKPGKEEPGDDVAANDEEPSDDDDK